MKQFLYKHNLWAWSMHSENQWSLLFIYSDVTLREIYISVHRNRSAVRPIFTKLYRCNQNLFYHSFICKIWIRPFHYPKRIISRIDRWEGEMLPNIHNQCPSAPLYIKHHDIKMIFFFEIFSPYLLDIV